MLKRLTMLVLLVSATLLGGCGYNTLQTTDEQVSSAWAEVLTNTSAARI